MTTSTAVPTKLKKSQVDATSPKINFAADTFMCLLVIAGSGAPDTSKNGIQFVQDVFTGGNTEVTGGTYARQTLTGIAVVFDGSSITTVDWTWNNIDFPQSASGPTNIQYAIIYDNTIGSGDASHPVVAVLNLDTVRSLQVGDLIIQPPTGGLVQWL